MARKKIDSSKLTYSKNDAFENLEAAQKLALNKKGKDDEINPDISVFLKAEELKGKLCGLYVDKEKPASTVNMMGSVRINGKNLDLKVGDDIDAGTKDD